MAVDEARVEELVGQLAGHMTGAALCLAVWLGDELGYYRAMAGAGPLAADDVAAKAGCNPRLTREWLDGQAAGGLRRLRRRERHLRAVRRSRHGPRGRVVADVHGSGHELDGRCCRSTPTSSATRSGVTAR